MTTGVRRRLIAASIIAVAVTAIASAGLATDRFDGVQAYWEDLLQTGVEDTGDVVVVAIDRATIAAAGATWPWDRSLHAELLDAIGGGEPSVVLYDVLFAGERDGDDSLADALARTPTVLGAALTLQPQLDGPARILEALPPIDTLAAKAADIGHVNISLSADRGIVRSLPLYVLDDRGVAVPSVVLAAVARHDGSRGPLTERPRGVQIGSRFIPLDDGELRINWADDLSTTTVIPAIDVVTGAVDPQRFAGRIVIVGVTEPTLGDQHLVPVDRSGGTSGVLVFANAANTILSNGYLSPASNTSETMLVAAVAVLVAALFAFVRLVFAAGGALAVLAAVVLFVSERFHGDGELWNVVWPTIAVVLAAAAGTGWRYVTETRHRRQAWRLFSTYVPASVVSQMEDPRRLAAALDGIRVEVTVLFCDLRGFTPVASTLPPPQVRRLLDHYYDYAVSIIHDHGGTVMQFVGDEVFGVFGAPIPSDDSARAVECAVAMQSDVARLDENLTADGLPTIRFGISVHRGEVVAAHVGTAVRRQYSVVGDTVNVGSRLCAQARAGDVVASIPAVAHVDASITASFVRDGDVSLKGVADPVPIFRRTPAPMGAEPAMK